MREVEQDSRKDLYNEPNSQGLKLRDLRYADDTALLSTTTEVVYQLIHSVKEHSENKGLFLNIKKTKIVDTDRCKKTSDITVDGETVECLENFEYLGSKIEGNGKCSNEIKRRTAIAAGQLKKMEKIWKGQDNQSWKSLEHAYLQQPYMGAKDGPWQQQMKRKSKLLKRNAIGGYSEYHGYQKEKKKPQES